MTSDEVSFMRYNYIKVGLFTYKNTLEVLELSENNEFQKYFDNESSEEESSMVENEDTKTDNNKEKKEKKPVKRTRLSNPKEIRRYMSSLIRRVEAGTLDLATSRALINIASELLKAYRTDVLEQQLIDLSRQLETETDSFNDLDDNTFFIKSIK